jgi:hypothetical protein
VADSITSPVPAQGLFCAAIGQDQPLAQKFGKGMIGRGMGRKPLGLIPLPDIPLPIVSLPSFGLPSSRCRGICAVAFAPFHGPWDAFVSR